MKLISLFAPLETHPELWHMIRQEDRLDELVDVLDNATHLPQGTAAHLLIEPKGIRLPTDWQSFQPPYILPEYLPLKPQVLLGMVFFLLGNNEKAWFYLENHPSLLRELDIIHRLREGIPVNPDELASEYSEFEEYRLMHNQATVRHYGADEQGFEEEKVRYFYHEAMICAPDDAWKAFSAKQYASFLTDIHHLEHAEDLLIGALHFAPDDAVKIELKNALCGVWMRKLVVPYDPVLLAQLKDTLWEVLKAFETQQREAETGLLLLDATHVATVSESFAEALGYVNRAIDLFREQEMPELLGNAWYRKGGVFYAWAKKGNPQFLRPSMEAYQHALKTFTRDNAPEVFAEIQHHLGVIYAEIPDEVRKKSVWAAVSSASFQEALSIFTKTEYPYEYAMVCNSFGNALTKYPDAIHSDNYAKALAYYQEALEIRRPERFPFERALTLLNHIEACWYAQNDPATFNEGRYLDMVARALEVKDLVKDPGLVAEADQHLERLDALKKAYAGELNA
jgi:tetratricopeptide (TPR) repeat protein